MKKTYYGAAYYPELWDKKTIEQDIRLMKETGINVVRMGEFVWSKMEPNQDEINVAYFTDIIHRLYENGIETVFCTPTPTPPIWMSHGHSERMHVNENGVTMVHGSRQHACTNNDFFRERSRIIIKAIAKSLGRLPGLIAWQTDNEFKCHVSECMCESCKEKWHQWLERRYKDIASLNRAWGTEIWSERYQSFSQVPQPVKAPFYHNASLSTAYRIFTREMIGEFQQEQIDILRRYSDRPITHNSSRNFGLDNELMFENLDFASFDMYPNRDQYESVLINGDISRNVKKGRPFWVMETSPSHNGHLTNHQKTHSNGFLQAEAAVCYAMGAEGFSYWLWRQQRTGCELPHAAILSAWGKPSVGYQNVLAANEIRKRLEPILVASKPCQAEVAMTYSDRARVYFMTEPLENLEYKQLTDHWYHCLLNTGIHRDLIYENHDLEGYKLLMSPFMPYLSDRYLARARAFVKNGGTWIVGPLSGGRTAEHTVHTDAALGKLETLSGVETVYTYPVTDTGTTGKAFDIEAPLGFWSSVFESRGAEVIGKTAGGVTPGMAFLTERRLGKGKIVMLGSMPQGQEGELMIEKMIQHYAEEAGVSLKSSTSAGTVAIPREDKQGRIWFVVNMDGKGGWVSVSEPSLDVINNKPIPTGKCSIAPYGCLVIKKQEGLK